MLNVKLPLSLSTRLSKLAGLDWQLLLAKLLIVLLVFTGVYLKGRGDGKAACEADYAKQAKAQLDKVIEFTPVADNQTKKAVEQEARVTKKKEVYDAQVDKNPRTPNCDLTNDELRAFQELVQG